MTEETESFIQVKPVDGPLGAEVSGVDLSQNLSVSDLVTVRRAWLQHCVLVFRDQHLTDEQLVRFGQQFGELHRVAYTDHRRPEGVPMEVELVSNIVLNGQPIGLLGDAEVAWHSDMSMWEEPATATVLYAEEVPAQGGGTRFCNLITAYEELSDVIKKSIQGRKSIHDAAYMADGSVRAGYEQIKDKSHGPGARHPIVRTHPETGSKALYLGRQGYGYILGLPVEDSDSLLATLWEHMVQPKYVWEHNWRKGDVLMWDNRCVAHARGALVGRQRRLLRRVTVKGDAPS
jgi:taurine dioxygenase